MGLLKKLQGAITFWRDPDARRTGVISTTLTYAGSMALLGVVFLILVFTGTFPPQVNHQTSQLAFYASKYALYILAGACAFIGITAACRSISRRPWSDSSTRLTTANVLLYAAMLATLTSTVMTIASLAKAAESPTHTPAYLYVIEVLVIVVRLLFLSTLLLATMTLHEAERDSAVAEAVVAGAPFVRNILGLPVTNQNAAFSASLSETAARVTPPIGPLKSDPTAPKPAAIDMSTPQLSPFAAAAMQHSPGTTAAVATGYPASSAAGAHAQRITVPQGQSVNHKQQQQQFYAAPHPTAAVAPPAYPPQPPLLVSPAGQAVFPASAPPPVAITQQANPAGGFAHAAASGLQLYLDYKQQRRQERRARHGFF